MGSNVIPAEWADQEAIIVGFPSHPDLWPGSLLTQAQQEVAALCNHLAETQRCYVLVANKTSRHIAERLLTQQAHIIDFRFGDIWFRDIAPIFKNPDQALRFTHNGWGGKYLYKYDDCAAARLAKYFNVDTQVFDYVLEGGALEHNGNGAILTTRQCLLNANRNGWTQADAETQLKQTFNATDIFWLTEGLAFDHTDGHIDNSARFVNAHTVLCQQATGNDDPNAERYKRHVEEVKDQGLTPITIPSPGCIRDTQGNVMPASHLNFVIGNQRVIFPHYLTHTKASRRSIDATKERLGDLFPHREIMSSASHALLTGGGSFHCISQHIPKASTAPDD